MPEVCFMSVEDVQRSLNTDLNCGLAEDEIVLRKRVYGENSLPKEKKTTLWDLILEQFSDTLVKILLLAAIISAILGYTDPNVDHVDAIVEPLVILIVLIMNAVISIKQTRNAEEAIDALKEYEPDMAKVLRKGYSLQRIKASELVPGDIVDVAVGDRVPADIRICQIKSSSLKVDQAILTGESMSVLKSTEAIKKTKSVVNQDKTNMLFSGSNIVVGKAVGIVIDIGGKTEIGRIWDQLSQTETVRTPLQMKLDEFGNQLSKAISVICILVWLINFNHFCDPIHGGSWIRGAVYYFKIAVALAVAAIPEGLPAVITTCLAIGTKRMAKKNAIVRSLPSVETLGSTSVICSDKTGTLTTNQMSIMKAFIVDENDTFQHFSASGTTYDPRDGAVFKAAGGNIDFEAYPILEEMTQICVLCNDAALSYNNNKQIVERVGEATEAALVTFSEKLDFYNVHKKSQESSEVEISAVSKLVKSNFEKLLTLEFTRDRKSMSVLCQDVSTSKKKQYVKGAPESIVSRCKYIRKNTETVELTDSMKNMIMSNAIKYGTGDDTLRCIALAVIDEPEDLTSINFDDSSKFVDYEKDMVFIGLVGMIDPPRTQVMNAISDCKHAGIRVIVITGDNKETAVAICRKIGLFEKNENVEGIAFSAAEFDQLSESEQREVCRKARLFARVEPSHKSKIVSYLQADGEITAMTGDGVNDAPALKKAEIGIAMGSGTAVAKSASDLVLADDDFSTIVTAVREGRAIFRNTVQFISYLVSSNIGEVISIFLTSMLGLPEGLIPVQLLWVNLITDGLPATALGFNPSDPDIMSRKPRHSKDPIISLWQLFRYTIIGFYVGFATIVANVWWYLYDANGPHLTLKHLMYHQQCSATNPFYAGIDCQLFDNRFPMTMSLSVLVVSEMLNAYNSVSEFQSVFVMPPWKNMFLMAATLASLLIHLFTTYFPPTQRIFQVTALSYQQWQVVFLLSIPVIFVDEIIKFFFRTFMDKDKKVEKKSN